MATVRALLARVTRLERVKAPPVSAFELDYGSLEAFEAAAQAMIDAGTLDRRDGPVVLASIRRWHTDEVWALWLDAQCLS
jgi:hypothetical protein